MKANKVGLGERKRLGPLAGLRVVEITDEIGAYAGKLLANLGADVILAEPLGGSRVRQLPPFFSDDNDPNQGMYHWYMNTSKRSIIADIHNMDQRTDILRLLKTADVLLYSGPPDSLENCGLGYEKLSEIYPRLVFTSITPFGLTGQLRNYSADDLILLAMGGLLYLAGHPGETPTAVFGLQSYQAASLFAVCGTLIAVYESLTSGHGQLVDVSVQESVSHALETAAQNYDLTGKVRKRTGAGQQDAGFGLFPCKDGLICLVVAIAGGTAPSSWVSLSRWMGDHPNAKIFLEPCWNDIEYRASDEAKKRFFNAFKDFAADKTKKELYSTGQSFGLSVSPVSTTADLAEDDQLRARDYFVKVDHPELNASFMYPGAPYRLQKTPWSISQRAPLLGEHTNEVFAEIQGISLEDKITRNAAYPEPGRLPLEGVRVADFTWVGAGPFGSKPLADYGADVIKIESSVRPDPCRLSPPFAGEPGINRSGYFANRNSNKRSICLNLKTEEGLELAKKLIEKSDVVFNNFRPGAMSRFGLDYEEVKAINPGIIYVDMPGFGIEGPARDYGGFGASIAAACGLHNLSGFPEKLPVGTGTHYPDHIVNPLHAVNAILAALIYRHHTGEGQHIEIAQFESSVASVGVALLTYMVKGEVLSRMGNRDGMHAPRAVLRCAGDDRWCAISIKSEDEWKAFCEVSGNSQWLDDQRFATNAKRLEHQDQLESEIEAWTMTKDPYEVMDLLQSSGISAGVVQTAAEVIDRDPSLKERHWIYIEHPEMGRCLYDGSPFLLSRTPGGPSSPAPLLGQHTTEVLSEVLGLNTSDLVALEKKGVLE